MWMRRVRLIFKSKTNNTEIVVGDNSSDNLNISIEGTKSKSPSSDKGVITIYNLNYNIINQIIIGKYYILDIWVGYKGLKGDGTMFNIYSGEVTYISQKIQSHKDCICYIAYGSKTLAAYSQNRINFGLSSSINVYTAVDEVLRKTGMNMNYVNIDEELKNRVLREFESSYGTASTILTSSSLNQSGEYTTSSDGTDGCLIDVTTEKGKRRIPITKNMIMNGNPTVTSSGLQINLLPVMNFKVGDILQIDNGYVDISTSSSDVKEVFNPNYMDTKGEYMIISITYTFQNRGNDFYYNINARALDIISKISQE